MNIPAGSNYQTRDTLNVRIRFHIAQQGSGFPFEKKRKEKKLKEGRKEGRKKEGKEKEDKEKGKEEVQFKKGTKRKEIKRKGNEEKRKRRDKKEEVSSKRPVGFPLRIRLFPYIVCILISYIIRIRPL
jgi:hypothetical protein